jgi:hypothetical protein
MSIRVGRCIYDRSGKRTDPEYPGYTPILCLTKSTPYGDLGPYVLKTPEGQIMENIWQFSKIYDSIPRSIQRYSRYDNRVIWNWPNDTFTDIAVDGTKFIKPNYWNWRNTGMNATMPIRYPVGFSKEARSSCIGALNMPANWSTNEYTRLDDLVVLDYIESRKQIYLPLYCSLVKSRPKFKQLKKRLEHGENLLIIEVDVAYQESLPYYKQKYGVSDDFIVNNTMEVNEESIKIMLNDTKHPFGHGYCLSMALLDKDIEWCS